MRAARVRRRWTVLLLAALGLAAVAPARAAEEESFAERAAELEPRDGLLRLWPDPVSGRLWVELPPGHAGVIGEYLLVEGLVTGLGSNPVGLDRGQLGRTRRVRLRRLGGKLLIEERNLGFRALTSDAAERRATEESFAGSVLWAVPVELLDSDGRAVADLTSFLLRDAHDVVATLRDTDQGSYLLDTERSAVDLDACLAFPENLVLEALVTYVSDEPGPLARTTAADGGAITLRQHQSLLRLPDAGYRPRRFDPRAGLLAIGFADYAAPLAAPLEQRWIIRHRLEKSDPAAAVSPAPRPIVYYVDPAIPEPVRSAVFDGARWWGRAFEAIGYRDAFRVELLPEDAHPLDARFNVIQWVHRSTRGWSYGGGVVDPLTGERVKGHVSLGSLRVRQDRLIFEGLLGAAGSGSGGPGDPVELALARIRQLAAHEVGHTLGLAHNFAASTYGRASVMDYPAPLVLPADGGGLDVAEAYGVGVGEWDLEAIRYAYSDFPAGVDEAAELERIVREGLARGLVFLSDDDARPPGAAQPLASLWDNGADPVDQLEIELEVRRRALAGFGERNLAPERPLALLQEVLATVYLRHRYQLEAAAKVLGGVDYRYGLRGDGQPPARPLPAGRQRRALEALLATLEPAELDLPERVVELLLPRPPGHPTNRELFEHATAPVFDALGAAATAADLTLAAILQTERAARLVDQHRRSPVLPGLEEVLTSVTEALFATPQDEPERLAELRRRVQEVATRRLVALAGTSPSFAVRSRVDHHLERLAARLAGGAPGGAHRAALAREIRRHLARPGEPWSSPPAAAEPPPGAPIGALAGGGELGGCSWRE